MSRMVIISILLICCSSCSGKFGVGIYDIASQNNLYIESKGYREFLLNSSAKGCHFFTWQLVAGKLIIRERDCQGAEKERFTNSSLGKVFRYRKSYLFLGNGEDLIFFQNGSLWLYDVRDADKKELFQNIDEGFNSVQFLEQISGSKILAVLKPRSQGISDFYSIVVIDKDSYKYEIKHDKLIPSISRQGMYAFSKENGLLAFFQSNGGSRLYGDIVILDLKSKQIIQVITNSGKSLIGSLSWNTNGTVLGYVDNNEIKTYSLQGSDIKTVKTIDKSKTCYHLDFLSPNTIIYLINDRLPKYSLISLHIKTGSEKILHSAYFSGDILLTADREKIIYENGY